MKRIIVLAVALAVLSACGGSDTKEGKANGSETSSDIMENPDYKKGLALIAANQCLTCHRVDEQLNGPPYREIANKYAGTSDTVEKYLANKIIQGGSGVWGMVPMTPHPNLSEEDAKTIARYILLLKK